jgi:3-mercaptopyruvate sulfurtransferase SseA
MDDRKASISPHDPGGRVGADAAPIAPRVRRSTGVEHKLVLPVPDEARRLPANPPREDPIVVFCGNAQRASEGFAIALRAMGVEGHVGLPTTNQNKEDN